MKIRNRATGAYCEMDFKAEGWGGRNKHEVSGYIYASEEAFKKKDHANSYFVKGIYTQYIHAYKTDSKGNHADPTLSPPDLVLWTPAPPIERKEFQYNFTKFALSLNHLPDSLRAKLPRSDCRLRPDIRAYENGEMELAANEKFRLEEKQRAARRRRAEGEIPEFEPKYF
jgi:hypothetical protein